MSDKKRNVPALRFNGFSDAWEQRKLGEVVDVNYGKDYKNLSLGKIPVYGTGGYMLSVSSSLSKDDAIGIGRKGTIDKPYILKAPFWTVDTLFYCIPRGNNDLNFIYGVYQKVNWRSKDESTGVPSLSKSTINTLTVRMPSFKEQQKIGAFFQHLDNTIALHQRKLDALKQMKKGFLQQMFPENGGKSPRVRFADFQEEWGQRKLEVLAVFSKGRGYTKSDLVEKGSPVILYGHLYTKYEIIINQVNTFVTMKDKSVISKGNEVIVPSSGETAKDISRASVIGIKGFILGGDLNIIKPKREINSIFLALTISNGIQQKEMIKRAQGKSIVHLNNSDLKQVKLFYPSLGEQQQIGDFFIQLERIITLYQNKLDQLNTLKRAYLKNMFI
ncbi:restriction endonuclease subunit S [Listeria booriae]|uniref:restriction endonuclease subunit S n=1 Tax=Listeria booriae TaxID=1552123 RepID=UPI0016261F88|nr:restriction endonuclease subunit S [Listeria booriae]MBC2391019.1 restriction endonuclease subunit S [Listeria booriae]